MPLSNQIKEDILQLIEYYNFIIKIFIKNKEYFFKFFSELQPVGKFDLFLQITWIIFCICKITILKRKYEIDSSLFTLICVYDIIKDFIQVYAKIEFSIEDNLANETHVNNIELSVSLKNEITIQLVRILKAKDFNEVLTVYCYNPEAFRDVLNSFYLSILLPDEMNDLLLFENNYDQSSFDKTKNIEITFGSTSIPSLNKSDNSEEIKHITFNTIENLDINHWVSKIESFCNLELDYLFRKFTKYQINKTISFSDIFKQMRNTILHELNILEKDEEIKIFKGFYVSIVDDFLSQDMEKFKIDDYTIILNDLAFHHNIFVIVCYTFLNTIYCKSNYFPQIIKEPHEQFLKIILKYIENINRLNDFQLFSIFKITLNLRKLRVNKYKYQVPLKIQEFLKNFSNWLITSVCWQDKIITEFQGNNHNSKDTTKIVNFFFIVKFLVKHIYQYIANIIFRLCINLNFSDKKREKVWIVMKYILSTKIELLRNSLLDSIIISSIYAVSKLSNSKNNISFNQIIKEYCDINESFSVQIKQLFLKMKINDEEKDIIQNYNNLYIPCIKDFLTILNSTNTLDLIKYEVIYPLFSCSSSFNDFFTVKDEKEDKKQIDSRFIVNDNVLGNKRLRHSSPMTSRFGTNFGTINSPFIPFSIKNKKFIKPRLTKKTKNEDSYNKNIF